MKYSVEKQLVKGILEMTAAEASILHDIMVHDFFWDKAINALELPEEEHRSVVAFLKGLTNLLGEMR